MAQLGEYASAVNLGRIVKLTRYALQSGQVDDHRVADTPETQDHQRRIDPRGIVQPGRRMLYTQLAQPKVDPAGLGVDHRAPDKNGRHKRDDKGKIEQRAKERLGDQVL